MISDFHLSWAMSMFQILTLGITCNLELDDELEESFGRRYMGGCMMEVIVRVWFWFKGF